jgi:hypothetical protein
VRIDRGAFDRIIFDRIIKDQTGTLARVNYNPSSQYSNIDGLIPSKSWTPYGLIHQASVPRELPRFYDRSADDFAAHPLQRPVFGMYKAHDCFQNRYAEPLGAGPLPRLEALFPTRKRLYSPGPFS